MRMEELWEWVRSRSETEAVEQALKEREDDRPWDETVYTGHPNPSGITIDSDGTEYPRLPRHDD